MEKNKRFLKYFRNPRLVLFKLDNLRIIPLSDKKYISLMYYNSFKKKINLNKPQTFNEKLNYLKLYDRKDLYTKMADKYEMKKLVKDIIGEKYVVKTYGIYDKFEDINFEILPKSFVIKTTHDSGGYVICKDKNNINIKDVKKRINKSLRKNYFYGLREWPYKNIKPRIMIEELLNDNKNDLLNDYKFWTFNGKPEFVYITIKSNQIFENFYDINFKQVDINHGFHRHKPEFKCPEIFNEMRTIASKLAKYFNCPFLRIDMFYVNGNIYVNEFTFYDWGGNKPFISYEIDKKLGDMIII